MSPERLVSLARMQDLRFAPAPGKSLQTESGIVAIFATLATLGTTVIETFCLARGFGRYYSTTLRPELVYLLKVTKRRFLTHVSCQEKRYT